MVVVLGERNKPCFLGKGMCLRSGLASTAAHQCGPKVIPEGEHSRERKCCGGGMWPRRHGHRQRYIPGLPLRAPPACQPHGSHAGSLAARSPVGPRGYQAHARASRARWAPLRPLPLLRARPRAVPCSPLPTRTRLLRAAALGRARSVSGVGVPAARAGLCDLCVSCRSCASVQLAGVLQLVQAHAARRGAAARACPRSLHIW